MTERVIAGVRDGAKSALARAISMVENGRPGFETVLSELHARLGAAHRIGITGPPGAGKSTLTLELIRAYRGAGKTVAVLAVDPTSSFSGGALLGDRIRMESMATDDGVYIRSMATRGAIGGLASTSHEVCDLLDAFGFDRIIVETVGIGQSELAIAGMADSAVLVLVPEAGDGVQVLKAGVMEIADLFVINKADRPGADQLSRELQDMLAIRREELLSNGRGAGVDWTPPVLLTTALEGVGVPAVVTALDEHAAELARSGVLESRRRTRLEVHTREVIDRAMRAEFAGRPAAAAFLREGLSRVVEGETTPYQLARGYLERFGSRGTA